MCFAAVCRWAQFSGSIQGTIKDPASAVVPNAKIQLKNTETNITSTTTSDYEGNFRFVSLAPGSYQMTVDATGFGTTTLPFTLSTDQNLNLPVALKLAPAAQTVEVTGEAPILNTAESRNQVTLSTRAIDDLPLAGRNMISLVTMAPGVIGIGTVAAGSPGSGVDNFSTETQVDASGNGAGSVGNMFMVDGLDVTSAIRPGVLNLTPNPDSVQEASIQTNTFSVEYGRASSVQMSMTTKSGTDGFHGTASEYFTNQKLFAGTEFLHNYSPYHSNNMSATIGGPIIPHHQFFFFFAIEPLRASTSTGNSVQTYEDPAFTAFAKRTFRTPWERRFSPLTRPPTPPLRAYRKPPIPRLPEPAALRPPSIFLAARLSSIRASSTGPTTATARSSTSASTSTSTKTASMATSIAACSIRAAPLFARPSPPPITSS